jgi:Flp pilus assembly protein TadB
VTHTSQARYGSDREVTVEAAKGQHKLVTWALVVLVVAVSLHLTAQLIVSSMPTLATVAGACLLIWLMVTIIRRRRDRW